MENLLANSAEAVAIILFGIVFKKLLFQRNLFRKPLILPKGILGYMKSND